MCSKEGREHVLCRSRCLANCDESAFSKPNLTTTSDEELHWCNRARPATRLISSGPIPKRELVRRSSDYINIGERQFEFTSPRQPVLRASDSPEAAKRGARGRPCWTEDSEMRHGIDYSADKGNRTMDRSKSSGFAAIALFSTPGAIGVRLEARLANYEYNGYEKGNRRVTFLKRCVITSRQNKI
jgi:hypothetical protein